MSVFDIPICGYCGRTQANHEPNDHPFDAVGGSLGRSQTAAELSRSTVNLSAEQPWYSSFTLIDWALLAAIVVILGAMGYAAF